MEKNFVQIKTAYFNGIEYRPAIVEVEITKGIGIHLVGLADPNVKESLLRVITAIQSLRYRCPDSKIVINIPNIKGKDRKTTDFDLAIALGVLIASEQLKVRSGILRICRFFGELGLDGTIRDNSTEEYAELSGVLVGSRKILNKEGSVAVDNIQTLIQILCSSE